jgi:hypothetical protein
MIFWFASLIGSLMVSPVEAADQLHKQPEGFMTPAIDGAISRTEWATAGAVFSTDEATTGVEALFFGWNATELFLGLQLNRTLRDLTVTIWRQENGKQPGALAARMKLENGQCIEFTQAGRPLPMRGLRSARTEKINEFAFNRQVLGLLAGEPLWLQIESSFGRFPEKPVSTMLSFERPSAAAAGS